MDVSPVTLAGQHVRLEPLTMLHAEPLVAAAAEGELWRSTFTVIPSRDTIDEYLAAAFAGQTSGRELAFVIVNNATQQVVGTTRFYDIERHDRRVAIGYTWVARSAQRTPVNTEAKLLLLRHAFETWKCIRVELITDFLNEQSRTAILRIGAKQEGILRNHMIMPGGRIRDSVCFSIIDSEWPEVKAGLIARLTKTLKPFGVR
jgi:RimJ/RimL family protein N-acetyltransferase